jgi:hypothetical protein
VCRPGASTGCGNSRRTRERRGRESPGRHRDARWSKGCRRALST